MGRTRGRQDGLIDRLLPAFREAQPVLEPPVVVACSGGPDSLALLALAVAAGLRPVAVHVDHGARPGSSLEADHVRTAAERLGAGFTAERVSVKPGPNFEARARDARYGALEAARARLGATAVLVGHSRDDQAESVLLNLLRGGAVTALAGIPPARGTIRRPLLDVPRARLREVCRTLGLVPLDDPMNRDHAFRRVWIRREVIPALEAGSGRDLSALLARSAGVARAESDFLDRLAAETLAELSVPVPVFERVDRDSPGPAAPKADAGLDHARLAALDVALARRVVRLWLGSPPPPAAHIDAVLAAARGEARAVDLTGGVRVVRAGKLLSLVIESDPARREDGPPVAFPLPGAADGLGHHVESWVERAPPVAWPDGRWTAVLDADAAGPEAFLRPARPAETFVPLGLDGHKPIAEALAEAGVPAERRATHPVLAGVGGSVLWVLGYRIDHRVRVRESTRRFLWLTAETGGLRT